MLFVSAKLLYDLLNNILDEVTETKSLQKDNLRKTDLVLSNQFKILAELKGIKMANEDLEVQISELQQATAVISAGLSVLRTDLQSARDVIEELRADGVSEDQLARVTAVIDNVQSLAQTFELAANPELPTPGPEDIPVAPELPQVPIVTPGDPEPEASPFDSLPDLPVPPDEEPAPKE